MTAISPGKRVLALCPEVVHMGFELQLEDVLLVDSIKLARPADCVAQQGETGQGEVILHTSGTQINMHTGMGGVQSRRR